MQPINLITLFCGRFNTFPPYLQGLRGLDYDPNKMRIIWYTNSRNPSFLKQWEAEAQQLAASGYTIFLYQDKTVRISSNAFIDNGIDTSEHAQKIAALYNSAMGCIPPRNKNRVFFLEDDVYAPSHTLKRLMRDLDDDKKAGYVCGIQFDRHSKNGSRMFAWDIDLVPQGDGTAPYYRGVPLECTWGIHPIGLGHLGGTLIDFSRLTGPKFRKPWFRPRVKNKIAQGLIGCDIEICWRMWQAGIERLQDGDVRLLHYDSTGKPH